MSARGFRRFAFAVAAIAWTFVAALPSTAGIIFDDGFESYIDTAALNAAWPIFVGTDVTTFLDAGPAGSTNTTRTVHNTNRASRRDRTFEPTTPGALRPLVVEYDLYDATASATSDASAYEYNQVLAFNGTTLTQLLSIGKTNLATTNGPNNVNKYQARVAFPNAAGGGVNWINLNTDRSVGWHTFKIEVFPTTVNFYVDGALDTGAVPRAGGVGDPFTTVRIGSGQGSRSEVGYYDNFRVISPEPGDIDLDGDVDRTDAARFSQYFGTTPGALWTTGDFDGDSRTTTADWALLQQNLGAGSPGLGAPAIPEPASCLLMIGLILSAVTGTRLQLKASFAHEPA